METFINQPPLPSTMTALAVVDNKMDHWLLVVVVIDCVAAAMVVVNGGNSGRC
jgi:hypothetical protein